MAGIKDIPLFPGYGISKDGRVWSKPRKNIRGRKLRGRWLKMHIDGPGRYFVGLWRSGKRYNKRIHRLVLEAFVGPCPGGMECRHLDGNQLDNRLNNLRWGTHKENMKDRDNHGTSNKGHQHGKSKLSDYNVRMIIYLYFTGLYKQYEIADLYCIGPSVVSRICNQKAWKHLWRKQK